MPEKLTRLLNIAVGITLAIFEIIICVQYLYGETGHELWKKISIVVCCIFLDALCFLDLYKGITLGARIVIYCIDFVLLLFVCLITGSTYLVALYCVILTQIYLNVYEIKTKAIVLLISGFLFIVTNLIGAVIVNRQAFTYNEVIDVGVACFVGLIVLIVHFCVENVLIAFYRNNKKLAKALSEADTSKKRLEEAYEQLSETAVFQERNRIARDIHDNAGHSMTAVIMQTEAAKLLIDTDPQEAKAKIVSANIQAKNALDQMRESVHLLAGRGEAASLKTEAEEILAQTMDGTDIKIRFFDSRLVPIGREAQIYLQHAERAFGERHTPRRG